jgi:flagellar biosynthesis/type III secretory pathway M-ring protein FliF/YscJ
VNWTAVFPIDWAFFGLALYIFALLVLQLLMHSGLRRERRRRDGQVEALEKRIVRLEKVSDAKETDERVKHDEDVVGLLGSLLDFNESLRRPDSGSTDKSREEAS